MAVLPALAGNNSGQAFSHWPDTGQAKCYDNSVEIPCPAEGQPFHGQDAQYNGHGRSYTDLGGGMIQDDVTGLIWEQKTSKNGAANYSDPHDADNTYTWCDTNPDTNGGNQGTCGTNDTMDFLAALNSANFGGHNDWRLPTIKELVTLADYSREDPSIDPVFAAATRSSIYSSSTTFVMGNHDHVWYLPFGNLDCSDGCVIHKGGGYNVRAVRGGQ